MFIVGSLAIQNTHRLAENSKNWFIEIARVCPVWMKILIVCIWLYGGAAGLFHMSLYITSNFRLENWSYWRSREISLATTISYLNFAVIYYATLKQ